MNFFGRTLLARLRKPREKKAPRSAWHNRAVLGVEQLDVRIVPALTPTTWTPAGVNTNWSNAANWSAGVPDATHVAILAGNGNTITLDTGTTNFTIGGLDTGTGASGFTGTLLLKSGNTLIVTADSTDNSTGFKWRSSARIQANSAADSIQLSGSGTTSNNIFSGGAIGNTSSAKATLSVTGGDDFQITGSAATLAFDFVIGSATSAGNFVYFSNQTQTLALNAGANITIKAPVSGVHNRVIFDTDTTVSGNVSQAISTASSSSYIDNYDQVIRRVGAGTVGIATPIKNETGSELQLTSSLAVVGSDANGNSIDQEGGKTDLSGGVTLSTSGNFLLNAGSLLTYGTTADTLSLGSGGKTLNMTNALLQLSADDTSSYGKLTITGNMNWTGGTFQCYVQGGDSSQYDALLVSGTLTTQAADSLSVTINGTGGGSWYVVGYGSQTGTKPTISGASYHWTDYNYFLVQP